jgi:hypothetical protein
VKFSRGTGTAFGGLLLFRNFDAAQLDHAALLDLPLLQSCSHLLGKLTEDKHAVPGGLTAFLVNSQRKTCRRLLTLIVKPWITTESAG